MRHRKKLNHLSRKSAHRKAMLANMASSLILHKRITTTTAKAKELRTFVEPIITRSKEDSTHSRRMVFKNLRDKYAVSELFREVVTKVGERPGGYTRIIKLGNRQGDNADMCIIELVDYNENMLAEKAAADTKPKSTRRRRGGKKKETGEEAGAAITAEVAEAAETEAEVEETVESVAEEAVAEAESAAEPEAEIKEETLTEEATPAEPEAKAESMAEEADTAEASEETGEAKSEEDEGKEEKKEE